MTSAVILAIPAIANGMTPASREEILCSAKVLILGTVVDAESHDCLARYQSCSPDRVVGLRVRIDQVLGAAETTLRAGQFIEVGTQPTIDLPLKLKSGKVVTFAVGDEHPTLRPAGVAITDAEAKATYLNRQYLFGLTPSSESGDYDAGNNTWELGQANWITKTWTMGGCDKWRTHSFQWDVPIRVLPPTMEP